MNTAAKVSDVDGHFVSCEVVLVLRRGNIARPVEPSGGATPGRTRSNDLAERSTALAPALASPCLLLCFASVNFTISDR